MTDQSQDVPLSYADQLPTVGASVLAFLSPARGERSETPTNADQRSLWRSTTPLTAVGAFGPAGKEDAGE